MSLDTILDKNVPDDILIYISTQIKDRAKVEVRNKIMELVFDRVCASIDNSTGLHICSKIIEAIPKAE